MNAPNLCEHSIDRPIAHPVPHSAGTARPQWRLPALACDSHMHIFDGRFPKSTHWPRTPPDAPVAAYRQLQARLGTTRTVVVTPSTYGTDNRCTLDAIAQLNTVGDIARGVAVVGTEVSDAELAALAQQKVCGLRVNFVSPQSWGVTTAAMLQTLAAKAANWGWHIQVFMHPEQIVEHENILATLPTPLVIDHMGRVDPVQVQADSHSSEGLAAMLRLLNTDRVWVKLSGAYMRSGCQAPNAQGVACADTLALGRTLVRAAPHRMLWGSDWPHTTETPGCIDDASQLNWLWQCCAGDAATLNAVLVDNPERLYGFDMA